MNILYIGPYRQKDINGLTSLQILSYLIKYLGNSIKCAPIYSESIPIESNMPENIIDSENRSLDTYDTIIQHANINQLVKIKKIPKNLAIPILDCQHLEQSVLEELEQFDSVLVDTKLLYNKLTKYNKLRSKLHTFNYDLSSLNQNITKSAYDLGILQHTTKLYFIGNYHKNITNIANVCKSFLANIKFHEYSLLLYLSGMDLSIKNNLEQLIKQLYINNNIKYAINRILIIPIDYTLNNLARMHNTGDIFLDLQDDSSNSLNCKLAKYFNKTIVQYRADDLVFSFDRNNKSNIYGFDGISEYHINASINNIINGSNTYSELPFKQTNLTQLL